MKKKSLIIGICLYGMIFSGCVKTDTEDASTSTTAAPKSEVIAENVPSSAPPETIASPRPHIPLEAISQFSSPVSPECEEQGSTPYLPASAPQQQTLATLPLWEHTEIAQFFKQHTKKSEWIEFTPSLTETVSITAKEGTVLSFPPHALIDENGKSVTTPVQLEVKECYKIQDILASNLSTKCGNENLETDGMVYFQAFSQGKKLKLDPQKAVMIEMPTAQKKQDMQLFYGESSPTTGAMNWRIANPLSRPSSGINLIGGGPAMPRNIKRYDLETLEFIFTVKNDPQDDRKALQDNRKVIVKLGDFPSKLNPYKQEIEESVARFFSEKNLTAYKKYRSTYSDRTFIPLAVPFCASVASFDSAVNTLSNYKNYTFKWKVPIEAILDRELYYKRNSESLVSNYVFDNRKWQADNYFFSKNYLLIKESGQDIYLAATTWREETNTMLSNYKAQYALSYIFAANQMGWINCDRFRYSPNSAEIYVKGIDTRNTDFKLIFEDENSILPGFAMGNQIVFSNIPAGKKVKLLGMRQTLQHPEFVIQSLETGKKQVFTNFAFQALNFSDLEKMLAVKN